MLSIIKMVCFVLLLLALHVYEWIWWLYWYFGIQNIELCPVTELIKFELLHTSKCFECVYIKISFVFVSPFHFRLCNCCSWYFFLYAGCWAAKYQKEREKKIPLHGLGKPLCLSFICQISVVITLINISSKTLSICSFCLVGYHRFHQLGSFVLISLMYNNSIKYF